MCVKQFVLNKLYIIFYKQNVKVFILFLINGLVCFHWQQSLCKMKTTRYVPDITLNLMLNILACFRNTALKNENKSIKGAIWVILYTCN